MLNESDWGDSGVEFSSPVGVTIFDVYSFCAAFTGFCRTGLDVHESYVFPHFLNNLVSVSS